MKIGITGASGFIGSHFSRLAVAQGHDVVGFSRRPSRNERAWNVESQPDLSGLDAVVNLAGESIFGRWTKSKKRRICESRIQGTRRLIEALAARDERPRVLVNASAIGFYGDTQETVIDENSPSGTGFLADVCRAWEAEAAKATALGVRVVLLRTGLVLGRGGALKLIGPIFRLGLGGPLGGGRQWMSAVHVDDVAGLILDALQNDKTEGPVNAVMAGPFRNAEFTREVARVVRRPAILPAPAFALRTVMGEMSHLLLDSSRVVPSRAREQGYVFRFASLALALQDAFK